MSVPDPTNLPTNDNLSSTGTTTFGADSTSVTHVYYKEGRYQPPENKGGFSFSNGESMNPKEAYIVTIGADATVVTTNGNPVNIVLYGDSGDATAINYGTLEMRGGRGLRAISVGPGSARVVNYGTVTFIGPTSEPTGQRPGSRLLVVSVNKGMPPHDTTHMAEAINYGMMMSTGEFNGRIDGLKGETGGGHLTRMINYGTIDLHGTKSRGLSAQTAWGGTQSHNFGTITVNGRLGFGVYAGSCAPWVVRGGCHRDPDEVIQNRVDGVPGDAYARNYESGSIQTGDKYRTATGNEGRATVGLRVRVLNAGKGFAINEGTILTHTKQSAGISLWGYGSRTDFEFLPPNTSMLDSLYAFNSGSVTTNGDDSHGIRAVHQRGAAIDIINSGDGSIITEGSNSPGMYAFSSGKEVVVVDCIATWDGSPFTGAREQCERTHRGGPVTVTTSAESTVTVNGRNQRNGDTGIGIGIGMDINSDGGPITIQHNGSITANHIGIRADNRNLVEERDSADAQVRTAAENRLAETYSSDSTAARTDNPIRITHNGDIRVDRVSGDSSENHLRIGIDAVSDNEDIIITGNGSITAPDIGIRATTSGSGKITINFTGEITADKVLEVNGGSDNEVELSQSAIPNLDQAVRGFVAETAYTSPTFNGLGFITAPDGLGVGGVGGRGFMRLDFRPAERQGDAVIQGWHGALGMRLHAGGARITPSIYFGSGDALIEEASMNSRRDFRQQGVGLHIKRKSAWLDITWSRVHEQTYTQIHAPGFAFNWRPPDRVKRHIRARGGMSLGRAQLSALWYAEQSQDDTNQRFGVELSWPFR